MFEIDQKDIRKLESDLKYFADRALPFATRKTLDDAAWQGSQIARADVKEKLINRNAWTAQSMRYQKSPRTLTIKKQYSIMGTTADYMERQEFGGTKRKTGKHGVAIPTGYSAGQDGQEPRTKLPIRSNRLQNIRLKDRRRYANKRQRNLVAIKQAAAAGGVQHVYLDLGRRRGLFRVTGGKRKPKVRMVHDLSRKSVSIPKTPIIKPAFDETVRMIPAFYADALRFQLRRHRILGY
jgi:hypothetical protein